MIESDLSPGRFERAMRRIPDGTVLRVVFYGLFAMAVGVVATDYLALSAKAGSSKHLTRTEPMPLDRPSPGDQIRPYLPKTIPVGPDRGEPTLPGYDGPVDGEAMAKPMRFIAAGRGVATAIGRIDAGTADDLAAFLAAAKPAVETLVVHSPGGSVADAITMARLLREKRVDTRVPDDGYCASACPLLFSGGRQRTAGGGAWIGVHQVYTADLPGTAPIRRLDRSIADIQATSADCQELLSQMGVDPAVWIKAMRTPADELYVLTADELKEFKLVTPERFGPPMPPDLMTQS